MIFDLAAVLVMLVAVSGAIWLFDIIKNGASRKAALAALPDGADEERRAEIMQVGFLTDLARSLFPIFLLVLLLRSFLVEPFRIPSNSMMPTLLTGDFILVNKYRYGIRLPVLNKKIIGIDEPQRGDVIVFRYPKDPQKPFIKRVVGLPGDLVQYDIIAKTLLVNGEPVKQKFVGTYQGFGSGSGMTGAEERLELLETVEHSILVNPGYYTRPHFSSPRLLEMKIPDNEYFVLGDNRDHSEDSRFWGTVPEANLVGKAFFIWMHFDFKHRGFLKWGRIGSKII